MNPLHAERMMPKLGAEGGREDDLRFALTAAFKQKTASSIEL